jgi:hypothetical protein
MEKEQPLHAAQALQTYRFNLQLIFFGVDIEMYGIKQIVVR